MTYFKIVNFTTIKKSAMPPATANKKMNENVTIVKKMKDYSNEPVFKKKASNAIAFTKKHGLPGKSNKNK
jgi:hypothetical protein